MDRLERLRSDVADLRDGAAAHPVFAAVGSSLPGVRLFLEHHVFAVWDFMSLLKSLQLALTSCSVPWLPRGDAETRRFVNEIVLAEESDRVGGRVCSHLELYLEAMREAGARTGGIERFLAALGRGASLEQALAAPGVPPAARRFVRSTFRAIDPARPHRTAAAFAIGREELIPAMFARLVAELPPEHTGVLRLYLDRHVALDGDEHGPAARRLLAALCGDDAERWSEATLVAREALMARAELWDAIALSHAPAARPAVHDANASRRCQAPS